MNLYETFFDAQWWFIKFFWTYLIPCTCSFPAKGEGQMANSENQLLQNRLKDG